MGQGQAMGLANSFQSLGRAAGPLMAGGLYDVYQTLPFWSGAILQAAALLWALRGLGKRGEGTMEEQTAEEGTAKA
jgi:MFS family permease